MNKTQTHGTTSKSKIDAYLSEQGISYTDFNDDQVAKCETAIRHLLNEALDQRSSSLLQSQKLHTALTVELEKAKDLNQAFLSLFEEKFQHVPPASPLLSTLSESQLRAVTKLQKLCLLKSRLAQATRALQDALRWSSLSTQIAYFIEKADWLNAATLLLQTTDDLNVFEPFLPKPEYLRRLHILEELYNVFLKALSPKLVVQLQTREPAALPVLAILQKLSSHCKINLYKQVRTSELESLLSSLEHRSALEALGDWVERESTWLSQTLAFDTRSLLLLELIKATLPITLPGNPEQCFTFLHRMERLFSITREAFATMHENSIPHAFVRSFESVLLDLAEFPKANLSKHQKELLELCHTPHRPASPTQSPNEALHQWHGTLQRTLLLLDQYWQNHVFICGPHLRHSLHVGMNTLWQQLLRKHLEMLPKNMSLATTTLDQHALEPYLLILGYASQALLPAAHRFQTQWDAPLPDGTSLPHSLHHHLSLHEETCTVAPLYWIDTTQEWMFQRIEQLLRLLLQPVLKHLPNDVIYPIPPPTLTSTRLSMKLPQFSLSPSPPITFVGDYLLQLPHYLDVQFSFSHPFVFGPPGPLSDLLSPPHTAAVFHGNDLILTIGTILQLEVLRGFDQSTPKTELSEQIRMDLGYLDNILHSLECATCLEWDWLLQFLKNDTTSFHTVPETATVQHPSVFVMKFWQGLSKRQEYRRWNKHFQLHIKKTFFS